VRLGYSGLSISWGRGGSRGSAPEASNLQRNVDVGKEVGKQVSWAWGQCALIAPRILDDPDEPCKGVLDTRKGRRSLEPKLLEPKFIRRVRPKGEDAVLRDVVYDSRRE
jgi:hypothetical protein